MTSSLFILEMVLSYQKFLYVLMKAEQAASKNVVSIILFCYCTLLVSLFVSTGMMMLNFVDLNLKIRYSLVGISNVSSDVLKTAVKF